MVTVCFFVLPSFFFLKLVKNVALDLFELIRAGAVYADGQGKNDEGGGGGLPFLTRAPKKPPNFVSRARPADFFVSALPTRRKTQTKRKNGKSGEVRPRKVTSGAA